MSKVVYEVIEDYPAIKSAEYYFYQNLIGLNKEIDKRFEEYYAEQVRAKHKTVKRLIDKNEVESLNSSNDLIAISSVKNNSVLILGMK